MKRSKIAIVILLLIALLTYWLTHRLDYILDEMSADFAAVEQALDGGGDLTEACLSMERHWHDRKQELVRFIPQYRVDDITVTVVRLAPLSLMEEKAEFTAELRTLELKFAELWEAHSPSVSSLF